MLDVVWVPNLLSQQQRYHQPIGRSLVLTGLVWFGSGRGLTSLRLCRSLRRRRSLRVGVVRNTKQCQWNGFPWYPYVLVKQQQDEWHALDYTALEGVVYKESCYGLKYVHISLPGAMMTGCDTRSVLVYCCNVVSFVCYWLNIHPMS